MTIKKIYTASATSVGGRGDGTVKTSSGSLDLRLDNPKEMGGKGNGINPEELFASGYSACFLGALKFVAGKEQPPVRIDPASTVTAHVDFGPRSDEQGFGIEVTLEVQVPGLSKDQATELTKKAHVVCPYSHSIQNNVNVTTTLVKA